MTKGLLVPERRRQIPGQFSWVDQQLVRGHHLRNCEHAAWALYVEFTLGEAFEHWAQAHHRAWVYFGGVTREVLVDNCKVAVLMHPFGQPATFHPRYLDLAQHYGFAPKACGVNQPHQKGRAENAVGYVKRTSWWVVHSIRSKPSMSRCVLGWTPWLTSGSMAKPINARWTSWPRNEPTCVP